MCRFLMFYIIFPAALAQIDERPRLHLPNDVNDSVAQWAFKCMKMTGALSEVVKRFFELKFDSDDASKRFLYCVTTSTYLGDDSGHLTEELMKLFDDSDYIDDVRKVFERCNKIKTRKPVQTMYEVVQCFYKNSPVVLGAPN